MSPEDERVVVLYGLGKDATCLDVERLTIMAGLMDPTPPQPVFVWLRAELAAAKLAIGVGPGAPDGLKLMVEKYRTRAQARARRLRTAAVDAWAIEESVSTPARAKDKKEWPAAPNKAAKAQQ